MIHNNKDSRTFLTVIFIISLILFLILIKDYIITLFLSIIFAGLLHPFFNKLSEKLKGKRSLSATLTSILFLLIIILPISFLIVQVVEQASTVITTFAPEVEDEITKLQTTGELPEWLPFREQLDPYKDDISAKSSQVLGTIGQTIISSLGSITEGTFNFIFQLFIMLYAMYFFLLNGNRISHKLPYYLPISQGDFDNILHQIISTSKATIKGAGIIGLIQGTLVGISFAIAGIPGALFWGAMASLASLIPSVGCAIIYVPAGIYLLSTGDTSMGIFVLVWGFGIVGTVDNILRPKLVGADTQMSDLMVLISTLGGITLFGIIGVILGPVIASIFITLSQIYTRKV